MSRKRVVVTGMGVVSCLGDDVSIFHQKLVAGESGISMITEFPTDDLGTKFAGVIHDFDPGDYLDKKQARRVDNFIAYGIVAAKKALEMGQLTGDALEKLDKTRCGAVIGSGMGGMKFFADNTVIMHEKGPRRVSPFFVPFVITNMASGLFAMDVGFMGPNYSISTACATGNNSIIAAANHIRTGEVDLMVCGGVEAPIIPISIAGFNACKALSKRNDAPTKASRPWDIDRDGFVMGEGAGVLLLESLEHAEARGAPIYAEYLGGALSCDAYHMTEPHPEGKGVALCMQKALEDAQISADQVQLVSAHATSTPAGDMAEVRATKQVLPDPKSVIMNATKSMTGHSLGAAGGLEAIATVKAIETGQIHPTINLDNPEPDLEFHVPRKAETLDLKIAMSNSFGFGGHNASIIFGKL